MPALSGAFLGELCILCGALSQAPTTLTSPLHPRTFAMNFFRCLAPFLLFAQVAVAFGGPPVATDSRLVVELVAREPDILTPTGIAVDERGRIWVVENNTHERPTAYQGPPSDRVRIFSRCDAQGRSHPLGTFAEGFRNTMGLALGKNGAVYVVTRSDVYLLRDTHGDGVADERRVIVRLDTTARYPHNGLSGFAFDALGNLYFGLGENLGAKYKLIGLDGTTFSGGGEGGSIYRCLPDGTGLVRIATGFWNPFHLAFDAFGRLFAVDNDPDSRGPCRLLHIVPGGDYGYRYRNGRKGLHPFTAWNGELPGTLPMVAGTAEAPCGVLAYEAMGLPPEFQGNLLVTSWGDHVVERFVLASRGASFTSQAQTFIKGGEDFRPVGITTAPDGCLYLSDWVDKSYPVHGKGRIWRIRWKSAPADDGLRPSHVAGRNSRELRALLADPRRPIRDAAGEALARQAEGREILAGVLTDRKDTRLRMHALWAAAELGRKKDARELLHEGLSDPAPEVRGEAASLLGQALSPERRDKDERQLLHLALEDGNAFVRTQAILQLRSRDALTAVVPRLADPDPFLAGAALEVLGRLVNSPLLTAHLDTPDAKQRLGLLTALRRTGDLDARHQMPQFLADPDPAVRRSAIQWVGEERLREYAPLLEAAAARAPVTRDVFEALLATRELLAGPRGGPKDERGGDEYVLKVVKDVSQPPAIRAVALRMLRPDHPALATADLARFVESPDTSLRSEAVRTLALRLDESSQAVLRRLAADARAAQELRAEAVLGLAHSAGSPASSPLLLSLLHEPALRIDALRSLRGTAARPDLAKAIFSWWAKIASTPDPSAEARHEVAAQIVLALRPSVTSQRFDPIREAAGLRPRAPADWQSALAGQGSPAAGERVFFHPNGPRCFACHRVDGRGTAIGPDLSTIGASLSREKLIESILSPSKEIAPQFVSWSIATHDGKVRTGLIVEEGPNSTVTIADPQGKLETINRIAIEERHALTTSIMPDNLHELMTVQEFRDLIAFLRNRK
jgi:putative membrane-bound dehydrogenase-like protein